MERVGLAHLDEGLAAAALRGNEFARADVHGKDLARNRGADHEPLDLGAGGGGSGLRGGKARAGEAEAAGCGGFLTLGADHFGAADRRGVREVAIECQLFAGGFLRGARFCD